MWPIPQLNGKEKLNSLSIEVFGFSCAQIETIKESEWLEADDSQIYHHSYKFSNNHISVFL